MNPNIKKYITPFNVAVLLALVLAIIALVEHFKFQKAVDKVMKDSEDQNKTFETWKEGILHKDDLENTQEEISRFYRAMNQSEEVKSLLEDEEIQAIIKKRKEESEKA